MPVPSFSRLRLVLIPLMLAALAACAQSFDAKVSRFASQLPPPAAGQSFAVVADDPSLRGGIEFSQYAGLVAQRMTALGYIPASAQDASLIVRFDYGVDKGREVVRRQSGYYRDPFYSPWYGFGGYGGGYGRGYGRFGGYGGFYGHSGFGGYGGYGYGGGLWGYGWNDPWFDNGYENYTVYTSGISLKIDNHADGHRLFEGKAEAASTSNRLSYLVPNLVEAMFTGFPGHNGETVRISVAPEKKVRQ